MAGDRADFPDGNRDLSSCQEMPLMRSASIASRHDERSASDAVAPSGGPYGTERRHLQIVYDRSGSRQVASGKYEARCQCVYPVTAEAHAPPGSAGCKRAIAALGCYLHAHTRLRQIAVSTALLIKIVGFPRTNKTRRSVRPAAGAVHCPVVSTKWARRAGPPFAAGGRTGLSPLHGRKAVDRVSRA